MSQYPNPKIEKCASLKEFLDSQLSELLPEQDLIIKNHLNLIEYLKSESPLFIVRKFKNYTNRGNQYFFEKNQFTVSDNEPAFWVFMETFYNSELNFFDLIKNQIFPIAFAIKKDERLGNIWRTIGRKHQNFSANGWKHCHIFQCSPINGQIAHEDDLKRRCLRLLSPLNHFPFFSPRKYTMPNDYGENEKCIEYVIWWLYNNYYTEKNKKHFKSFVEDQGFTMPIKEPKDIKIEYSKKNENDYKVPEEKNLSKIDNKKTEKVEVMKPRNNSTQNNLEINYFKISEEWYGKNIIITVTFTAGKYAGSTYQYNHDEVYNNTITHYEVLDSWTDYGWFSNSKNIPKIAHRFVTKII